MYFKLFFCLLLSYFVDLEANILCEVGFCENFRRDPGCGATSNWCSIANSTHNGLVLPSTTICNCCHFCMPLYPEGHHCSLGGAGYGNSIGRCGHGLYCMEEDDGNYCRRMNGTLSACHAKQDEYDLRFDQGLIGALEKRPHCDGKGNFATYDCVPTQTCFCQSEEGERLFGEAPYQVNPHSSAPNMHCGCSRLHHKIDRILNSGLRLPAEGPRCTPNGDFNPIQCIERTCYCVDRVSGVITGSETVDLDDQSITELSCYDANLDLFPAQSTSGPPYNYTTPCYESLKEKDLLLTLSEEEGYDVSFASSIGRCLPDGTFGRISETRNRTRICVDERGHRIGEYEADMGTPEYEDMDCKCALTVHTMGPTLEPPVCCRNGNFRSIQCRRGVCRCVDADGRQISTENTRAELLPCYSESWHIC